MKQAKTKKAIKASAENKKKNGQKGQNKKEMKLRIVIIEDNPADAELMERQLKKSNFVFVSRRVESKGEYLKALKAFKPDLILADYKLPKFDALQALALRKINALQIPFIIVTGSISEEIAVECIKQGADDYLLKDRLARLGEAVRHAFANRRLQAEKKSAEESLLTSEQLYQTFIDSSTDMAFLKGKKFRHLLANRELCRFYGKPENEVIGKTDFELMEKKTAQKCRNSDRQALSTETVIVSEEAIGDLTFETRKFPVKLADGRIGVGGYIRDISERKRSRQIIEQSAKNWYTTFDSIQDGILLLATDQTVLQANRAFADLLNKPFKEIIGKKCYELVHPTRRPDPNCPFAKMLKSKKRESMELAIDDRVFAVIVDPITAAAGTITGATHILSDITERKRMEQTLRESEDLHRDLVENSQVLICTHDLKGNLLSINRAATQNTGYPLEDLLRMNLADLLAPEVRHLLNPYLTEIRTKGRAHGTMRIRTAGGETRTWEYDNTLRTDSVKVPIVRSIAMDITERRRAESQREAALEALRKSEFQYKNLVDNIPDIIFTIDLEGKITFASRRTKEILGYENAETIHMNIFNFIPEEDRQRAMENLQKGMKGEKIKHFQMPMIAKSGERLFFECSFSRVYKDGAVVGAQGTAVDISERKRAEEALRINEAQLSNAMVIAKLGYWEYDVDDDLFIFNDHFYDIFRTNAMKVGGYKISSEQYAKQFVHPDDIPIVGNEIRKAIETTDHNFSRQIEHRIIYADGEIGYISVRFFIVKDSHGRTVKTYGANQDITERKRAEEALRESEKHYRDLVEKGNIAIVIDDIDGNLIYFNDQFLKLFGYSAGDIEGKTHKDFIHPDSFKIVSNYHQKRVQGEKTPSRYEFKGIRKDGSRINVEIDVCEILKKAGKISGTRSYMWDITERKNMENELKDSEIRYHNLFENSSEFIYTLDLKGNFTDVNKAALALTGYTKSELLKMNFKDYTPKKDHRNLFLALSNVYKTGKPLQNLLIEAIIKDKSKKYFETNISLIKEGEQIIGYQGSSKDITERKHAEEQIRASLLEKEVLLKEIHHRVKNNLQIISGLLTLQAAQINDERLQRMVKESQGRIWTMALIHQTLYQSGNLADIDMADYIRSLAGNLLSSHAQVALPPTISFDLLPVRLVIDKAIPLALIINELLTNAMKYAFPDGRIGEIRISLQKCRDKSRPHSRTSLVPIDTREKTPKEDTVCSAPTHELTVADDGIGLPGGFDPKNQKSLGLRLVDMLVKQLGGQLTIESCGGTSVRIKFSNNEKNEKQS